MGEPRQTADSRAWPEAVSDGLTLPCFYCDKKPMIDYTVTDDCWAKVPDEARRGVVCLDCLTEQVDPLAPMALTQLQVVGAGVTVICKPTRIVLWDEGRPSWKEVNV